MAKPIDLPTSEEIYGIRFNLGLTQMECAALMRCGQSAWSRWENAGSRRKNQMPIIAWELFLLKTGYATLVDGIVVANPGRRPRKQLPDKAPRIRSARVAA